MSAVTLCGNGRKMPVLIGDMNLADSTYFYDVKKTDSNMLVAVGSTTSSTLAPNLSGGGSHPITVAFNLNDDSNQPAMKELSTSAASYTLFSKIAHDSNVLIMVTDEPATFIEVDDSLELISSFKLQPVSIGTAIEQIDLLISGNMVVGNLIIATAGYVFFIDKSSLSFNLHEVDSAYFWAFTGMNFINTDEVFHQSAVTMNGLEYFATILTFSMSGVVGNFDTSYHGYFSTSTFWKLENWETD